MNPLRFKLEAPEDLPVFRDCLLDNEMDEEAEAVAWLLRYKKGPRRAADLYYWRCTPRLSNHTVQVYHVFPQGSLVAEDIILPSYRAAIWALIMAWPHRRWDDTYENMLKAAAARKARDERHAAQRARRDARRGADAAARARTIDDAVAIGIPAWFRNTYVASVRRYNHDEK